MSFFSSQETPGLATPYVLYDFTFGTGPEDSFRYTNADSDQVVDGKTYEAIPIKYDGVKVTGNMDRTRLTIRMFKNTALSDYYRAMLFHLPMSLTIRHGHHTDASQTLAPTWAGRVVSVKIEGAEFTVIAEPTFTLLRRLGQKQRFQYGCPHVLYGAQCSADKAAATSQARTVSAKVGETFIDMVDDWSGAFSGLKYLGGTVSWSGYSGHMELRGVASIDGNRIYLSAALTDIESGRWVNLTLGCNHQIDDCADLHREVGTGVSNVLNFGGFPWIPNNNPVGYDNNQFY